MPQIVDEIAGQVFTGDNVAGLPLMQARMLRIALGALSSRALVWAATLGGGACWAFAIVHPEPLRLIGAVGYCLLVLVPVLIRDLRGG